ncbi:hypothetical protein EST38_g660 [Candolleomyces aberdarensis]|uniref:DUF788-domain-containing protein n=1 Tax=Candolleomyces aberdarensis TaxID=2316362 RepID=A0A4Q2E1A7_9AGAR|nr:hypothetical protein EST38_g660 [Candolleomyces aberdarensis]
MANASAKRIANQNEAAVKQLRLGLFIPTLISLVLRFLFRRDSLPPSKGILALYVLTYFPAFFLSNYLIKIGTTRRDPQTGALISYGEDLNQTGVTEWCFDILYITWACQVGSGAFGDWFWWLYLVIPLYAVFKLWTSVISPMVLGRGGAAAENSDEAAPANASKRQEKLRKRQERAIQQHILTARYISTSYYSPFRSQFSLLQEPDFGHDAEQNGRIQLTAEPPAGANLIDLDEEPVSTGIGLQPTLTAQTMGLHADLFGIELEAFSASQPLVAEEPLEAQVVMEQVAEERDDFFNAYKSRDASPTVEEISGHEEAEDDHMYDAPRPHEISSAAAEMLHEEPQGESDVYSRWAGEHDTANLAPEGSSPVQFFSSPGASSQTSLDDYDLGYDKSDHSNLEEEGVAAQHGAIEHSIDHAPSSSPPPFSSSPLASSEPWGDDYETDYGEIQCPGEEERRVLDVLPQFRDLVDDTETRGEYHWQIYEASAGQEWIDQRDHETGSDEPSELDLVERQHALRDVGPQEAGEEEHVSNKEAPFEVGQDTGFIPISLATPLESGIAQQEEASLVPTKDGQDEHNPGRDFGLQEEPNAVPLSNPSSMYFKSREPPPSTQQQHASSGERKHETWQPLSLAPPSADPNETGQDFTRTEDGIINPAQGLKENFNGNENGDPFNPGFGPAGHGESIVGAGLDIADLDIASRERQMHSPGSTWGAFAMAMTRKSILKVEPHTPHGRRDDDSSSSPTYGSGGIQGLEQHAGAGLTHSEHNTDEESGFFNVGDQDETSSKVSVKLPQDADLERQKRTPAASNNRLLVPSAPNPKRPTIAGQLAQHKKLSKPFRCPTISKPKIDSTAKGEASQDPANPARAQLGQQKDTKIEAIPQLEEDSKIKHRTVRAAAQFRSPLTALPSGQQAALIRPTPTIQALDRKAQTLRRAIRVVRDNEEETLKMLIKKWTEAGREVAFELWTTVKDSAVEGSGDRWDGGSTLKRKVAESWGWDDGADRKRTLSGSGSSWGWDPRAEGSDNHAEDAPALILEEEEQEKMHETIGTMLMQLGICPTTLGWVEEDECFVD